MGGGEGGGGGRGEKKDMTGPDDLSALGGAEAVCVVFFKALCRFSATGTSEDDSLNAVFFAVFSQSKCYKCLHCWRSCRPHYFVAALKEGPQFYS